MIRPPRHLRLPPFALVAVLLGALLLAPGATGRASAPRAHAANSYLTGIGDEQVKMFSSPLWLQLHTRIARYIAPYDAATLPDGRTKAIAWIHTAEAAHQQVLVAFYHSEHTPMRMPSVQVYQRDVAKFVKMFPNVRQYQPWDEANRGTVQGYFVSPSPYQAAQYYQALIRTCRGCNVVGVDVLDAANIGPTLEYISEFKHSIGRLRTLMPRIWGLHNYADVNRFETWRTREIVAALGGQVWLTETGGIVQFANSFPNHFGSGLTRAASAISLMFRLAGSLPQIKRLYIYDWTGGNARTRFDAGLMNSRYQPRPGYVVVCRHLHAARCSVHLARN